MSRDTQIHEVETEIDRLSAELANMQEGPSTQTRSWPDCEQPPPLRLFDESISEQRNRYEKHEKPPRKETEARRFNGKKPVHEYLLQFDLTAKRNRWTESEKALSLLCALDGQARSILSEIDDVEQTTYTDVRKLLVKRFGPLQLTEIHEQSLRDLKLSRGQLIRELAPEAPALPNSHTRSLTPQPANAWLYKISYRQFRTKTLFSTLRRKTPVASTKFVNCMKNSVYSQGPHTLLGIQR